MTDNSAVTLGWPYATPVELAGRHPFLPVAAAEIVLWATPRAVAYVEFGEPEGALSSLMVDLLGYEGPRDDMAFLVDVAGSFALDLPAVARALVKVGVLTRLPDGMNQDQVEGRA